MEGGGMDPSSASTLGLDPQQLKRALEWELAQDSRELRSHAWYHGAVPRQRAEEVLAQDGDFLVRDCLSQPGDYVLTCRWKGQNLHFVISKIVVQPDTVYERVQYRFEDDAFDAVPDLITYYVGSGKPVSAASGARIHTPRNRLFPLSFYAAKYGLPPARLPSTAAAAVAAVATCITTPPGGRGSPLGGTLGSGPRHSPYNSYRSPLPSPPCGKRGSDCPPPRLPAKTRSQSLTPGVSQDLTRSSPERSSSADGVVVHGGAGGAPLPTSSAPSPLPGADGAPRTPHDVAKYSTHSLPRTGLSKLTPSQGRMIRVTSDPTLSPCPGRKRMETGSSEADEEEPQSSGETPDKPPPKPSRVPSVKSTERVLVDASTPAAPALSQPNQQLSGGSDSGNGSGDSVQSGAAGDGDARSSANPVPVHGVGVVLKKPHPALRAVAAAGGVGGRWGGTLEYDSAAEDAPAMLVLPDPNPQSAFDLENFQTLLLPPLENKPLDATALQGVKLILADTASRVLACHLTKVDLDLLRTNGDSDLGLGVTSGIELCTLPHGHQLRLDLIERTECLKLLVAVSILSCPSETERAELLHKWIQVAIDTKTALGNLYGFCGLMLGLCLPQVLRLSSTWHVLRQRYTESAYSFEAKLRPTMKAMRDGSDPQAPNTTIPHLLPFLLLIERSWEEAAESLTASTGGGAAIGRGTSALCPWDFPTSDFGLQLLLTHLEQARKFSQHLVLYRRNAEIALEGLSLDELALDTFKSEFHLKFLWGSRGARVSADERHAKFEQLLGLMSERCEPDIA